MPMYDYICTSCRSKFEKLVAMTDRDKAQECSFCAGSGYKVPSPTRSKLNGLDPGFPDAYDKWTRQHEKAGRITN